MTMGVVKGGTPQKRGYVDWKLPATNANLKERKLGESPRWEGNQSQASPESVSTKTSSRCTSTTSHLVILWVCKVSRHILQVLSELEVQYRTDMQYAR